MMPVLDGYGTLKILQKNPLTQHIPFIFLTAKAEKQDFRKGMNMGADDYISKPFTDVELLEAVEIRLKKHVAPVHSTVVFNLEEHFQQSVEQLLQGKEFRSYQKKDLIFKELQHPRAIYWIKSGKVQTTKTNEYGKELVIELYGKNDFVGTNALFQSAPYQATAVVIEATEVAIIPKDTFINWVQSDNSIAQYFIQQLAREINEKNDFSINLAYSSVRKRIADALLRLHRHYHEQQDTVFQIQILREELAHIVGTTKETVIRTLSEFKKEGIIDIQGSMIRLLDIQALQNTPY